MSLKSFDKFCEKLITTDPEYEKEIFDERQKLLRSRLNIEAMLIYICITYVNCLIMDTEYQWAESHFGAMSLFVGICALYWLIRLAAKGCLYGISGSKSRMISSVLVIISGAANLVRGVRDIFKDGVLIKDGMLTDNFLITIMFALFLAAGIVTLCAGKNLKKINGSEG